MDYGAINETLMLTISVETFETTPRECVFVDIIDDNTAENKEEFTLNLSFGDPVAEYISQLLVIIEGTLKQFSMGKSTIFFVHLTIL